MIDNEIRLNKYIATNFGVSRREADDLIAAGRVKINGKKAEIGMRATKAIRLPLMGAIFLNKNQFILLSINRSAMYVAANIKVTHQLCMIYCRRNTKC